jgi:hypothetical protein
MPLIERDKNEGYITLIDKERGFRAEVKFDGCVHLDTSNIVEWEDEDEESVFNDSNNVGYLHICDVDRVISFLTELRKRAKSHFGPNWPN